MIKPIARTRSLFATFSARVARPLRDQLGFTLLEVLVSLSIFGFIGVGLLAALSSGLRAQDVNRVHVVGENLARAVLEDIRFQPYADSYTVSVPVPSRFSFTASTAPFCAPEPCTPDINLQRSVVTTFRGGEAILTVEDLKVRR